MELRGRWGLVTGAAKRIGRSIALALAGRGLNVIVHYNASDDAAAATVREIEALGVRALALPADLGRGDDVARLAREAEARSGGVDV
ncbi:MAG: SDR family NAD(P)-dependent oxidoreductase, partial [Deltaproteobacteria bacterium]